MIRKALLALLLALSAFAGAQVPQLTIPALKRTFQTKQRSVLTAARNANFYGLKAISYNPGWNDTLSVTNQTGGTSRLLYPLPGTGATSGSLTGNVTHLRVVICGFYISTSNPYAETNISQNITYKVSVEPVGGGTPIMVTWGGSSSLTCAPGSINVSDDLPYYYAGGTSIPLRIYHSVTSGQQILYHRQLLTGETSNDTVNGGAGTDLTASGTVSGGTAFSSFCEAPNLLIGDSDVPAVMGLGDSIMYGTGLSTTPGDGSGSSGYNTTYFYRSAFAQAMRSGGLAYANFGFPSTIPDAVLDGTNNYTKRLFLAPLFDVALSNYGTNSLGPNNESFNAANPTDSSTSPLGYHIWQSWAALANRGLPVYQTTMTPRLASTASFTTTVGDQVLDHNTPRTQCNDWIRTAPAPLSGCIDWTRAVEADSSNTLGVKNGGCWYVNPTVLFSGTVSSWSSPNITTTGGTWVKNQIGGYVVKLTRASDQSTELRPIAQNSGVANNIAIVGAWVGAAPTNGDTVQILQTTTYMSDLTYAHLTTYGQSLLQSYLGTNFVPVAKAIQ